MERFHMRCLNEESVVNGAGGSKKAEAVSIIPLSRANNISIMLTQFSNFRRGPHDIRRAVCAGELGPERLSLLLQARPRVKIDRIPYGFITFFPFI